MKNLFLFSLITGALLVLTADEGCKKNDPTAGGVKNVADGANAGCQIVEALTGDGTVKTICAVTQEIDRLIDVVFAERGDGGGLAATSGKCVEVVGTGGRKACASVEQVARWIDDTNRRRASLLVRDAGSGASEGGPAK